MRAGRAARVRAGFGRAALARLFVTLVGYA